MTPEFLNEVHCAVIRHELDAKIPERMATMNIAQDEAFCAGYESKVRAMPVQTTDGITVGAAWRDPDFMFRGCCGL